MATYKSFADALAAIGNTVKAARATTPDDAAAQADDIGAGGWGVGG